MKTYRHRGVVEKDGQIKLPKLPLKEGTLVEVIIFPLEDEMPELVHAAESGLDFWDNPIDDEVWNDA